eukprot:CAMPEP_0172814106 /NCGR_PEP_ID=MMETSP1075-20121228/11060_1 /TAXON_ID=2916 /ORGANISM="Ceratium fusus, Strain PA161109" /LENGTH=374 /DNA_ID=CAMNT_0013653889 /DNA_START=15 /DNA_END=1136 /DNA_ORIENTATION=-
MWNRPPTSPGSKAMFSGSCEFEAWATELQHHLDALSRRLVLEQRRSAALAKQNELLRQELKLWFPHALPPRKTRAGIQRGWMETPESKKEMQDASVGCIDTSRLSPLGHDQKEICRHSALEQWVLAVDDRQHFLEQLSTRFMDEVHFLLKDASPAVQADRECVLAACRKFGTALADANITLKADKEVVMAAVQQDGWALQFAERLKADKEVAMAAVQHDGWALQFADNTLRMDKEVAMTAMQQDGWALQFADDALKADKEVVMAAVQQHGPSLEFADNTLKADNEVVMAATTSKGSSFQFADDSLKADRAFVLACVAMNGSALEFAHDMLKTDKEIVMAATASEPCSLKFAKGDLCQDPECLKAAERLKGIYKW